MATCKRCETTAEGTPEELFEQGWGDGGTLCPECRAVRNTRAQASTNRIVSGLADHYASQMPGARKVTIRQLPGMAIRSSWIAALGGFDARETAKVWREVGDGAYLMTMEAGPNRLHVLVEVEDGIAVEQEPIAEAQIGDLPMLAERLGIADQSSSGKRQRQQKPSPSSPSPSAPTSLSVKGVSQLQ